VACQRDDHQAVTQIHHGVKDEIRASDVTSNLYKHHGVYDETRHDSNCAHASRFESGRADLPLVDIEANAGSSPAGVSADHSHVGLERRRGAKGRGVAVETLE
jgi:hypothetical protein